jgi:GNAT superfamily N-acetyltransferase
MQPFALSDLPGVYRVCAEVSASGGNVRQQLQAPDLAGHIYAGPYLSANPALSWVVADDLGVGGYIVSTADAVEFESWREVHWYPPLRARHPLREPRPDGSADDYYLRVLHAPPRLSESFPTGFPAELHIKLDARITGRGWGRRLVTTLLSELRARKVEGVHLGVAAKNTNAIAFYDHLGFHTFARGAETLVMVKGLS